MSSGDGLDGLGHELLRSLRDEPLDVHQIAADLGLIPGVINAELKGLMDHGLVHGVTTESGRQAWGLTVTGRTRLHGEGEP
jgi:DNA-binding HxlR family transcriptional regulator